MDVSKVMGDVFQLQWDTFTGADSGKCSIQAPVNYW